MPLTSALRGTQFIQQPADFHAGRGHRFAQRTAAQLDHHIHAAQAVASAAEHLAYQALRAIAVDRPARDPSTDDDTDARLTQPIGPGKHGEMAAHPDRTGRQGSTILFSTQQPHAARQRRPVGAAQTPNRERPLARLARNTARPPRVRMRTRKPWVRLRRVTDG